MTLPTNDAITRFGENEERVNVFVNQSGSYQTSGGEFVETLPSLMTRLQQRYLNIVNRGDWASTTVYAINDVAKQGGVVYLCVTPHTSDTFATDLAAEKWVVYQALNSEFHEFIQAEVAAVERTVSNKLRDMVSVKDFGAAGNGLTDDTAAIQAALDATVNMTPGFGGTGRTLYFPNGIYLCGDLEIKWTGTRLVGESKYGTLLYSKSGAECVIKVGGIDYLYPVGDPLRNINRRHTTIENLTIDYTNLTNTAESAAIRYQSSYGNSLRNVEIEATDERLKSSYALYFGEGCYTTVVENVTARRVRIYSPTADAPTTLTFINLDSAFVDINTALGITFLQPVIQSRISNDYGPYRMKVVNCNSLTCIGGDWEDDNPANYMYYFDNVGGNVVSMGNATQPFQGGYAAYGPTGITGKRLLQDDKDAGFQYREGNWTPSLSWSTPGDSTIVPSSANGRYVRVGNLVTCSFNFDNATFTNGTASGYLILSGLPFPPKMYPTDMQGGVPTLNIGFPTNMQSILVSNADPVAYLKKADGSGGNIVVADVSGAGKYLRGTFTYQCAN